MEVKPGSRATHLPWPRAEEMALRLKEMQPQDILSPAVFFMLFAMRCGRSRDAIGHYRNLRV